MTNFSLFSRYLALGMLVGLSPLMANDGALQAAKGAKQVCEMLDGHVRELVSDPAIITLVKETNTARDVEYQQIASRDGTDVAVVGQIAAQEIVKQQIAKQQPNYACP